MLVINAHNGFTLASEVEFATTFRSRLKGLLGRSSLPPGAVLVLYPCSSIHTFFMKFPIDVLFLSSDFEVLAIVENIAPFRFSRVIHGARMVMELPAGTIKKTKTQPGHRLKFNLVR